jgi:hypothetical protein
MKNDDENEVTAQQEVTPVVEETQQEETPVAETAKPPSEKEKKDEQKPNPADGDVRPKDEEAKKQGIR